MYIENFVKALKEHNLSKDNNYVFDHMVYVRLFEGCNVFCKHCFIPANPKKIDISYYENMGLTDDLIKHSNVKEGNTLYLQWHGGEPTMLGVNYLENAISEVEKDTRFKYKHGIQTNLVNFHEDTEKWVSLYRKKFNNTLGVSWDWGIRHLKKSGLIYLPKANREFEQLFWDNIKLAQENSLDLYMVVTFTKAFASHYKNPVNFYSEMEERGIKKINFERITKTGMARQYWEELGLSNLEYADAMARFFNAYIFFKQKNPEVELNVSPFDGLLESVLKKRLNGVPTEKQSALWDILSYKNQGYGCWNGSCDTSFHTIDANGYKKGCTALNSEEDNKNKIYQTIDVKSIKWIKKTDLPKKEVISNEFQSLRNDRQQSCTGCEFLSICSSGCLSVEKFDESQHCSGAKNLFIAIDRMCQKQGF